MSDEQSEKFRPSEKSPSIGWPVVGLFGLVLAFLFGIFVFIPNDEPQSRTALLGFVVLAGQAVVAFFLRSKVNAVDHKVNGRMTQLIDRNGTLAEKNATLAEQNAALIARVGEPDVSRETSRTRRSSDVEKAAALEDDAKGRHRRQDGDDA